MITITMLGFGSAAAAVAPHTTSTVSSRVVILVESVGTNLCNFQSRDWMIELGDFKPTKSELAPYQCHM